MKLMLYGREYCSLCRVMRDELSVLDVAAIWVDVDDYPDLELKYGEWVPALVTESGEMLCHYHLDRMALDAYLADFR